MPEPIPSHGFATFVSNSEKISVFLGLNGLPFGSRHSYNSAWFG